MENNNTPANTQEQQDDTTISRRFTEMVIREYVSTAAPGALQFTEQQRRLVQGYFVTIDRMLKASEENRVRKNNSNSDHKYDNALQYSWNTINMSSLALDVARYARMGLDMQEKNHLFPIPYANKKTGKYDISFTVGYSGIQYIAQKYAMNPPKSVTVEVVYTNDVFKAIKKGRTNPIESYEFDIANPFDRGKVVGGFGYIEYYNTEQNKLIIMSEAAILKRMGKNANPEFWGTEATGKKSTVWENGKKVQKDVDGWYDEMVLKTLIREVYSSKYIPRDPSKMDDDYQYLKEREVIYAQAETDSEAQENANKIPLDIPDEPVQLPSGENQTVGMQEPAAQTAQPVSVPAGSLSDPDF